MFHHKKHTPTKARPKYGGHSYSYKLSISVYSILFYNLLNIISAFIILKFNELVLEQRTLLIHLPHYYRRRTNHHVLHRLLVETYRIQLSAPHRTQWTKTDHAIVHSFVCDVLVGFLSEEVPLICDHGLLWSHLRRILFVVLVFGYELPRHFFDYKGLPLFDFEPINDPESSLFLISFHSTNEISRKL